MAKTVVGLMESTREAETVARNLVESCGCERGEISLLAQGSDGAAVGRNDEMKAGAVEGASGGAVVGGALGLLAGAASLAIPGFGPIIAAGPIASALAGAGIGAAAGGIMGALANLGVPDEDADYYAEGIRRGGTLVSVRVHSDEMADCAANVMRRGGREEVGQADRAGAEQENVLPVAKEELVVGKREVSRGGVRVYSYVRETPAEESVQLREERAVVERRPVDRPAGAEAFSEKSVEIRETAEEAVVTKRARVVEEVVVSKETTQREETIRDTVRSTDVRVEQAGKDGELRRYGGPERRKDKAPYAGRDRRLVLP